MAVNIYRHTDAGAPSLTGQLGSLVALLDAVLVNGYGAKPAAGWTKAFSAANKAAYRQNAAGANNAANPMYLYVDDTGPGAGSSREARIAGFETMSAITPTGTGQFPATGQTAIGAGYLVARKSNTADAVVRGWTIIANGQTLYAFIESGDYTSPFCAATFVFGDIKSYKAGDLYAVIIMGRQVENQQGQLAVYDPMQCVGGLTNYNLSKRHFGHFMARSWTGLGGSVQVNKNIDMTRLGNAQFFGSWNLDTDTAITHGSMNYNMGRNNTVAQLQLPNGPDGGLWFSPVYIGHHFCFRGYLPGLWAPLQDRPAAHGDTITIAAGPLTGKSMVCMLFPAYIGNLNTDAGQCFVEYSDTWT